jgi:hypothetical protein
LLVLSREIRYQVVAGREQVSAFGRAHGRQIRRLEQIRPGAGVDAGGVEHVALEAFRDPRGGCCRARFEPLIPKAIGDRLRDRPVHPG